MVGNTSTPAAEQGLRERMPRAHDDQRKIYDETCLIGSPLEREDPELTKMDGVEKMNPDKAVSK
jgi:hypothetical protein